jgi:hypothetical protein
LHPQQLEKEFAVAVDVSKEPVGKVFLVLINATYWNGFSDAAQGDASTYTDDTPPEPSDLSLLVLFPSRKMGEGIRLDTTPNEKDQWKPYADQSEAHIDTVGHYLYWNIRRKAPGHHFRVSWNW